MTEHVETEPWSRDFILQVRLNKTERRELDERVIHTGYSRSALTRYALFRTPLPQPIIRPDVDSAAIAKLLEHFGKTCSNINQYSKRRNMGRDPDSLDPAMEAALRMLLELRAPLLSALGIGK
ncbi:MAG: hypothetical protein JSS38_11165 [Nitrospira sp.]|nr:hypothetical protein [Nitrospira sp.]